MGVTTSEYLGERRRGTFTRIDPAVPETVPVARASIAEFAREAGLRGDALECLELAVSEAITNAVLHAYDETPGRVYVSAWITRGRLVVHVADDGTGLLAGSRRAGLGLGLALIAQICDGFEVVDRSSGGTEVQLQFTLDD